MTKYLLRVLSSKDHDMNRDDLIKKIKELGTDRYDSARKQVFDDFYGKHRVDFFATEVDEKELEAELIDMVKKFPDRTFGDRGVAVVPDIAIIYDASKCKMIDGVYDYKEGSDCFQFKGKPKDALIEVRPL